jgi:hypothetical protein
MIRNCSTRSAFVLAIGFTVMSAGHLPGQETPLSREDALAAKRFALMEERIKSVIVSSKEGDFPKKLNLQPLFRYNDPVRQYVAAAVWKLGEDGRPKALVTTELHRQFFGQPRIVYEYLSLTPTAFSATSPDIRWAPQSSSLTFKPFPDAPAPADTPQRRLLQIRALARQFAGSETVGKEKAELRLLPQPIDRYVPSSAEHADGAMFLLAFGTNPEVALLIETDGKTWSYAAGRLTGASKVQLTFAGEPAWTGDPVKYGSNQPYTASNSAASIPGVAPDGTETED